MSRMAKYIIDMKDGETLYKAVIAPDGEPYITTVMGNVYKEPDLDAIRNEAYEKGVQDTKQHWVDAPRSCAYKLGYENGLNDAWEAAGKISMSKIDGGLSWEFMNDIFGTASSSHIYKTFTASEAIEKIRQYEQGKEEHGIKYEQIRQGLLNVAKACNVKAAELSEVLQKMTE